MATKKKAEAATEEVVEAVVEDQAEAEAATDEAATDEVVEKNVVKNLHSSPLQIPTGQTVPVGGSIALSDAHAKKCKSHGVFASWVKAGVLEIN